MLNFIANGIRTAPEFDVSAALPTETMETGPAPTLKLNVTDNPPGIGIPSIYYEGLYYSVNDTAWDRRTFFLLNVLFQTAIGKVESVAIPITIAK